MELSVIYAKAYNMVRKEIGEYEEEGTPVVLKDVIKNAADIYSLDADKLFRYFIG